MPLKHLPYANNKDEGLHSLINIFVICSLDSVIPIGAISKIVKLASICCCHLLG